MRTLLACLSLTAVLLTVSTTTDAADRVALLLGNARYADPEYDLRNPAEDARALADALTPLGFQTEVMLNADQSAADAAVARFATKASGAEIALFFFAGHGAQIGGENRLLTSGFAGAPEQIGAESLSLATLRTALAAAQPKLGLILLDACRDNPLAASGLLPRGLGQTQRGVRMLVLYAAERGEVAYDGAGSNSVLTTALLQNISEPGIEVRLMVGRVRQAAVIASDGRQVPWVEEAVLDEHYLNPAPAAASPDRAIQGDLAAWRAATEAGGAAAFRGYLEAYPDGLMREFAEERLQAPAGVAGDVSAPDAGLLLASADPATATAALEMLGFLSARRGGAVATPAELDAAFAAYAREMAGGEASAEGLYLDATQRIVMLGAATAPRIRADLRNLVALETTLEMADRTRAELAALAATRSEAAPVLARADQDIAVIRATLAKVDARLDATRGFYATLVARGSRDFRPYLARSLGGLSEGERGIVNSEARSIGDAEHFVQHATADGVARPEGSIAWLADFLPRD